MSRTVSHTTHRQADETEYNEIPVGGWIIRYTKHRGEPKKSKEIRTFRYSSAEKVEAQSEGRRAVPKLLTHTLAMYEGHRASVSVRHKPYANRAHRRTRAQVRTELREILRTDLKRIRADRAREIEIKPRWIEYDVW